MDVQETAKFHSVERTSPMGERFLGTCRLCGKTGLTTKQIAEESCMNPGRVTVDRALTMAVSGDDHRKGGPR